MRPTDWFLVGLPVDPVLGDGFGVRVLAAKYAAIAEIADDASLGVNAARTSGAASAWVGDAGSIFRDRSQRMPAELAHARESYAAVDAALRRWADTIDDTQAQADRALQLAREAHVDRQTAGSVLASAELAWTTARAQQLTYQAVLTSPLSVPGPSSAQLRSTDRAAQHAQSTIASARGQLADADARLAAARTLVLEAKERRDDGERATVHAIATAGDLAVKPSSVWEAIQDSAAWQTIVMVATVVLTIVSIVAIFVGGPLVWALILAATILLVVNALLSIAQGKDAWGELILLAVGLVPGGRLLGLAIKGVEAVDRVSTVASHVAAMGARLGTEETGAVQITRTLVEGAGQETRLGAQSAASSNYLAAVLAMEEGLSAGGRAVAGDASVIGSALWDIERIVRVHGGDPADWVKMVTNAAHKFPLGTTGSTHWLENLVDGRIVEVKLVFG